MRAKILIVEDNTELLELLRSSLKQTGYLVSTAENGVEALKKARSNPPDLVVLDLVLPELDGFAVCEAMRRDPALAMVPIIILTGLSSEFTRLTSLESGASECVTKPVSPGFLLSKIQLWLRKSATPAVPHKTQTKTKPSRQEASIT